MTAMQKVLINSMKERATMKGVYIGVIGTIIWFLVACGLTYNKKWIRKP